MKQDIVKFAKKNCEKYGMHCYYMSSNDSYLFYKYGKAIMNVDTKRFYQLPKSYRSKSFLPLIRVGLNHNYGEGLREQLFITRCGTKIA